MILLPLPPQGRDYNDAFLGGFSCLAGKPSPYRLNYLPQISIQACFLPKFILLQVSLALDDIRFKTVAKGLGDRLVFKSTGCSQRGL